MQTIYITLTSILVIISIITGKSIINHKTINPIVAFYFSINYFIIFPLCVLILNNGYTPPAHYRIDGDWLDYELSYENLFSYFFSVILISTLLLTILINKKRFLLLDKVLIEKSKYLSTRKIRKQLILLLLLLKLPVDFYIIFSSGGATDFFSTSFHERTMNLGGGVTSLLLINIRNSLNFLFVSLSILYINILYIKKQKLGFFNLILIILVQMEIMITTGNRIFLALFIILCLAIIILHRDTKNILKVIFLMPVISLISTVWMYYRSGVNTLTDTIAVSSEIIKNNSITTELLSLSEGFNVIVLQKIINDFGDKYDYLYGASYIKLIFFIIPRSIYEEKTINFTQLTAKLYAPDVHGYSINSTIFGEMYANTGLFSFLTAIILVFLIKKIFTILLKLSLGNIFVNVTLFSIVCAWLPRGTILEMFIALTTSIIVASFLLKEKTLSNQPIKE